MLTQIYASRHAKWLHQHFQRGWGDTGRGQLDGKHTVLRGGGKVPKCTSQGNLGAENNEGVFNMLFMKYFWIILYKLR